MIFSIIYSAELDTLTKVFLLVLLPAVVLLSLGIHEYAHAAVSYSLGDPTAKRMGRLTVDPFKHINPLGTLCMLLFGFGWAKPVPVDPRYYEKPKKGMALCGLAGPAVNAIIGVGSFVSFSVLLWLAENPAVACRVPLLDTVPEMLYVGVANLLWLIGYYNILLAVFNLIPVPPLDGSRVLYAFLPDKQYFWVMKYERVIMFVMLALLWFGVFDPFLSAVPDLIMNGISNAVGRILDVSLGAAV